MFLIDELYLKERVNISQNKEAQDLKPAFYNVTELAIKPLLSIPLYQLYLDHVDSETELTPKQSELFEKVRFYFALMVQYDLMLNLFDITNKGNQQEPNSPSLDVIKFKRGEVLSKAEQIKTQILAYLSENKADFPQYFSGTGDEEPVVKNNAVSPIIFGKSSKLWLGGM